MLVFFAVIARPSSSIDAFHLKNDVLILRLVWFNADGQARGCVRRVPFIDNTQGRRLVVWNAIGLNKLNDYTLVQTLHRAVVVAVCPEPKGSIAIDSTGCLNAMRFGQAFNRTELHRGAIGKENLTLNWIGLELTFPAT